MDGFGLGWIILAGVIRVRVFHGMAHAYDHLTPICVRWNSGHFLVSCYVIATSASGSLRLWMVTLPLVVSAVKFVVVGLFSL